MKSTDEMAHNSVLMKRCNKTYNIIVTIYAGMCAFYAGIALFGIILGQTGSPFMTMLEGVILKALLFFCGLMACYKHDTKFTLFAIATALIGVTLNDNINGIIFVISVVLSIATASVNKEYHYLENQFGFPYFNERFEEQNLDTRQRGIKDEYQQNYERLIKTSSSDMTDIDSAVRTLDLTAKSDSCIQDIMDSI